MMDNKLWEMVLPHNLLSGTTHLKKIEKLINTARELGGTVYEVAVDSGLLSAEHFMQVQFEEDEEDECPAPENMTVVTECYIEFGTGEPQDRIFLYSANALRDRELLQEGEIRDRKLVIPYEKLETLHEKGYKCIYGNAPNGRNGKAFARYNHSFGEDKRLERYQMWDWFPYVGDGFNQGLMLQTPFDTILVMPDLHAVKEAIKTYHAENLVREMADATFCIERINMQDTRVLSAIRNGKVDILGSSDAKLYAELKDSYKKLIYQIAYIQMHYPQVYEIVWADDFEADDEKSNVDIFWDNGNYVTLGICLDGHESYAVCKMSDGSLKRVPNMDNPLATPLCQKYRFKGYGNICNAGTAGSRMALIMQDIIKSAEFMLDVSVQRVNVTHPGELPDYDEIDWWIQRRRKRALEKKGTDAVGDLIAYDQIAELKLDGEGLIKWAAELADLTDVALVNSFEASMKAFEVQYPGIFQVDKPVLLYLFTEKKAAVSIVKKHADGRYEIMDRVSNLNPEDSVSEYDEEFDAEEYFPGLLEIMEHDMEEYMLESGLSALGISVHSPYNHDMEAWEALRKHSGRVKRQFRRNDTVSVLFDNGFLQVERDYPIERLEKCFMPILEQNASCLRTLLDDTGMRVEDISELILIGEETEYPFVRKHMEQLVGKKAKCLNASDSIEARGAALYVF